MLLLTIAKNYKSTKGRSAPVTDDEIELLPAYLAGEITTKQAGYALKKPLAQTSGTLASILMRAVKQSKFVLKRV